MCAASRSCRTACTETEPNDDPTPHLHRDIRHQLSHRTFKPRPARGTVAALKRLDICLPLPRLAIDAACEKLAERLISTGAVPATEQEDALHIAFATLAKVDFIATWNFAHLVGPVAKYRLQSAIEHLGYAPPLLATHEELLETLP